MERRNITNEYGENVGWFDVDAAHSWDEDREFDGSNMISVATGSQWDHERLFLTAKGAWVLKQWSQWQGSRTTYQRIYESRAVDWLVANGEFENAMSDESLPAKVREAISAAVAGMEA